jgi:hypothetical protein
MAKDKVVLFQENYKGMSIITDVMSILDEEAGTWTCYGKVIMGRTLDTENWEFGEQGVRCTDNDFGKAFIVVGQTLQKIVAEADDTFFTRNSKELKYPGDVE